MWPRAVTVAVSCLVAAGCGGSGPSARPARPARAMRADGLAYALPAGWRAAQRSLTPHLANPRELLTVSTGPLPRGGACAHLPSAALAAMTDRDVLVTVQERFGDVRGFGPRPRRFDAAVAGSSEAEQCVEHPAFASHLLEFGEHGRGFHVLVAIGRAAPAERVREADALLDSLRVAPAAPSRARSTPASRGRSGCAPRRSRSPARCG